MLCRIYRHETATLIVMQQLYRTIEKLSNEGHDVFQYFSDALTNSMEEARWQYLLLLYARYLPIAPPGSFGLSEIGNIMRTLYPSASDGKMHEILSKYREAGLVCCSACIV
jgi:hypothetical protein